jgi:di-heme oxidoreductase (putative peroxidase)
MNQPATPNSTLRVFRRSAIAFILLCACNAPPPDKPAAPPTGTPPSVPATPPPAATFAFSKTGRRLIDKSLYVAQPVGGKPTPQREPSIDQDKLLKGGYSLAQVLEAGQNQFNLPFDPEHGFGEGANGPRSKQRAIWNPRGGIGSYTAWPFLRVNGIDSQSCFECHSSIGQFTPPGAKTVAQVRKPGAQGGPAGAANSAFINDQFPEALGQLTARTPAGQPVAVLTKFVRNPPVVFGTGYTQRLATEMTTDLLAQQAAALTAAERSPGSVKTIALMSKGLSFGTLTATCTSGAPTSCTVDTSKVTGVQPDLTIRPFQWGGISSSVRHFAMAALDFHFSVQAVEKVGSLDCDGDGLIDEITVGNVTALTAYVTMFRTPDQVIPPGTGPIVQRGRQLLVEVGCTGCHSDQMVMDKPTLTIQTPPPYAGPCPQEVSTLVDSAGAGGSDTTKQAQLLVEAAGKAPAVVALRASAAATPEAIYAAMKPYLTDPAPLAAGNYQIDLNLTGVPKANVPAYVWPRLRANKDGKTPIPLFSDLRLHFMGKALSDDYAQPTDGAYSAQPGVYVTRVLWGIGDTAPYMHDGRARTLPEAIMLHGADGSEAQPVFQKFAALPAADQAAIIAFLESQRLPISKGITETEYVSQ